jgi:uncharacterized protein (TIGR02757 family)
LTLIERKALLLEFADKYNHFDFIQHDPISIPHQFSKKQDIEIIGFWVAMLSWGNRKSIINKGKELCQLMEFTPYEFIMNHSDQDLMRFEKFVHRTFNATDALYFISFFKFWYSKNDSLESAFAPELFGDELTVESHLESFHAKFFSLEHISIRTKKHVSKPSSKSRCKRLAMFLRWMVRNDESKVDFGIWSGIKSSQLVLPLDLHVEKTARKLGMITRKQLDWMTVLELTDSCRKICPEDPCILDYALFGMSIAKKE